ncbi:indole-3-glycerol phosphate synthase TrpC [Patescibacteria group bacterium]|nr:indole-3-glycerol phosphate synthase TrpC [Patescibacteria group bacterium]MBU2259580.1 indole-3-glycerol phosphate synthase TrpC [Patescibacteria group bacterium]
MSIISKILEAKQAEVDEMEEIANIPSCKRRNFVESLLSQKPSFIAEIKPKSPSEGEILAPEAIPEIVKTYDQFASAISVLCDKQFFGGGYDLLSEVAAQTDKPLLAKEFIISEKQIARAVTSGASAILLIAAIVEEDVLTRFIHEAIKLDLSVLLELHTMDDIEKAASAMKGLSAEENLRVVLGINNRDLDTLNISLDTTTKLVPKIKEKIGDNNLLISESGISSPEDVRALSQFVDGFLVGTSILKSSDPGVFFSSLKTACDQK